MPVENGVPNLNLDAGIFDWGALDAGYFLDLTDAGMSLIDGGNSEDAGGMSLVDGGVGPEDAGILVSPLPIALKKRPIAMLPIGCARPAISIVK